MSALNLIKFYVNNYKTIPNLNLSSHSPTLESQSLALVLATYIKVKNPQELLCFPNLLRELIKHYQTHDYFVSKLEKDLLNPCYFSNQQINTLADFLDLLSPSVKNRISDIVKETNQCLICYDDQTDYDLMVFQCGHLTCSQCLTHLTNCPYCRQPITATNSKQTLKTILDNPQPSENHDESELKSEPELVYVKDGLVYIQQRLQNLFANTSTISPRDHEELSLLLDFDQNLIYNQTAIKSEELRTIILGERYHREILPHLGKCLTPQTSETLNLIGTSLTTPNRLLRFLCYLRNREYDVDGQIILKLPNAIRRWIMSVINQFADNPVTHEQFHVHRQIWKLFFKAIHASEYSKYLKAQEYVGYVRDVLKYNELTPNGQLESYIQTRNPQLFDFLLTHTGLFYRHARRILSRFADDFQLSAWLSQIIPKLRPAQRMELLYVLDPDQSQGSTYINKKGHIHWTSNKIPTNYPLNYELIKTIILNTLTLPQTQQLCVIDDRHNQLTNSILKRGRPQKPVEWLGREPSKRGSVVELLGDQEFVCFIYWKNGLKGERVDLDLSVQGYDKDFNTCGECSFRNHQGAFNGATVFSGDITDAPLGASEFIRFKLHDFKQRNPTIRYLTINTMSYTEIEFDKMAESLVGIGLIDPNFKGEGPYNSLVLDACRLEGPAKNNIGAYIDLESNQLVFMNLTVIAKKKKGRRGGFNSLGNHGLLIRDLLKNFISWKYTCSSPADYFYVALNFACLHQQVIIYRDDVTYLLTRQPHQSNADYLTQILSADPTQYEVNHNHADYQLTLKSCLYFGFPTLKLLSDSIVVSNQLVTNQSQDVVVYDEPYKLFL